MVSVKLFIYSLFIVVNPVSFHTEQITDVQVDFEITDILYIAPYRFEKCKP